MLLGEIFEFVDVLLEGGVVDEDVELPEFVDGLPDGLLAEFRVGYVA